MTQIAMSTSLLSIEFTFGSIGNVPRTGSRPGEITDLSVWE